jgi:hypothetical protein
MGRGMTFGHILKCFGRFFFALGSISTYDLERKLLENVRKIFRKYSD